MSFLLSVYSLSVITQTNKETNKQYTLLRSTYNTILQYLQDSDQNDYNNINYKNYLHKGPFTPCGKMSHKENLNQS